MLRKHYINQKKLLKIFPFLIVIFLYLYNRINYIQQVHLISYVSNDFLESERALNSLINGENPYTYTINSYDYSETKIVNADHGFAYFPLFLYTLLPLKFIAPFLDTSLFALSRVIVLIADIVCGVILIRIIYKKDYFASIVAAFIYFFNPYNLTRDVYSHFDPLAILFIFLSLIYLNRNNFISGAFFAISIGFKSFAYILFPILILLSNEKKKFFLSGALTGVIISLPFFRSFEFFTDYIKGSLLVHSERPVQGRPMLYFLSLLFKVEFLQTISNQVYTYFASLSGLIVSIFIWIKYKINDKYILSSIIFIFFYIFTPVLNRTYLMFFIPIFIVGAFNIAELFKKKYLYYILVITFYLFYLWYLSIWNQGFHERMQL